MGTTPNKLLRYPEPTVLANTLHTQIKNLAEDVDKADIISVGVTDATQSLVTGDWWNVANWVQRFSHPDITLASKTTFTLVRSGLYHISARAMFRNDVSSNGVRGIAIVGNGSFLAGHYSPPIVGQADYASSAVDCYYRFAAANAQVQIRVLQNSGGNVTLHTDPYTQVSIRRIGG